jgi:KDO2-lipid IV(A) lauroyltransferase
MTISSNEINKRFVITNLDLVERVWVKTKYHAVSLTHYASWEWLVVLNKKIKGVVVYKSE